MARKIEKQRSRMEGLGKKPLHVVNLSKLSPVERKNYQQTILDTIGHSKHLVFINGETKFNEN